MAQAPLDPDEATVFIGSKVTESLRDEMDRAAKARSMSKSELIREAVRRFLDAEEVSLSA